MEKVFVGLGSNLDNPISQLQSAIACLQRSENIELHNVSSFYCSSPMGPQDQPDYINAVVELSTHLSAENLLDLLQEIENKQGRIRSQRWGARTLDLDILLYGNEVIITERLIVPHNGISERNFVLCPLQELVEENFEIPNVGKISKLLENCSMTGITRLKKHEFNG